MEFTHVGNNVIEARYDCACASVDGFMINTNFTYHSKKFCKVGGEMGRINVKYNEKIKEIPDSWLLDYLPRGGVNEGAELCFCKKHPVRVSHSAYVGAHPQTQKSLREAVGYRDSNGFNTVACYLESIGREMPGKTYPASASAKNYNRALTAKTDQDIYKDNYWKYVNMPTNDMTAVDNALKGLIASVTMNVQHIKDVRIVLPVKRTSILTRHPHPRLFVFVTVMILLSCVFNVLMLVMGGF